MPSQLHALCFDAHDPHALARFWAGVLGFEVEDESQHDVTLLPDVDPGFRLRFVASQEQKVVQNQMHFDLTSSSLEEQEATVDRALRLGGRHCDVGQRGDEGARRPRGSRGQRVLRHRTGQQLPRPLAASSGRSPATGRATSSWARISAPRSAPWWNA